LEAKTSQLKSKEWPYAVIELYLGNRSPEATLSVATKDDERCEAEFYIGEWHLLRDNRTEATIALKVAADTCPKNFIEHIGAVAELKRLNNP
jgi:lipoprotein NlpI